MKYIIKEEPERLFYGEYAFIDLKRDDNEPFGAVWDRSAKSFDMKYFNPSYSPIGLEMYPSDFMENRRFRYAALMPIKTKEGLDRKKIVKLQPGRFICFEVRFGDFRNGITPKIYDYIMENNIPVEYGFDYEEYPMEFDPNNPDSLVYVCLPYKGE